MNPIVALTVAGAVALGPWPGPAAPAAPSRAPVHGVCLASPEYYAFELFTTKNLPGTGYASGTVEVTFEPSPFSVSLAEDGSYAYDVAVELHRMKAPRSGVLVAWVATRELDRVERLGVLDAHFRARGRVDWNKYIVVVSHEASDDPRQERWQGPIALRGMSRSGRMHTMAGHGAFQQENCAAYGYGN